MQPASCSSLADLLSAISGEVCLFSAGPPGAGGEQRPLERLEDLDLWHVRRHLAASAAVAGRDLALRDPHFGRLAALADGAVVIHVSDLGRSCPMPGATNVQVVRRRELFDLTREGMNRGHVPFRRRILGLMDHLLLLEPVERLRAYGAVDVFEGASLLQLAAVDKDGPSPGVRGKPIQHRAASFQTGPYNHLGHPERPALGSLHLRVLVERAAAAGRPFAVLLASPETTAETGLLMRVFRALGESGAGIDLLVLFFGTPEEMERSVGGRPQTTFFGDNFACPAVRCLFAPFSEAEVVFALQRAAAVFDTAYGGTV